MVVSTFFDQIIFSNCGQAALLFDTQFTVSQSPMPFTPGNFFNFGDSEEERPEASAVSLAFSTPESELPELLLVTDVRGAFWDA